MPVIKRRRHKNDLDVELKNCATVEEVIDALGGKLGIMAITGRNQNHVINWRNDGLFPSNTYVVLNNALAAKGYAAPPSLWRMLDP